MARPESLEQPGGQDRQQAGYPSPERLIQPQPWGCFLARGISPCSELPASREAQPRVLCKHGWPWGMRQGLGAEGKFPGDGLEEEQSPEPPAHAALAASPRDGHPGFPQRSAGLAHHHEAFPASHLCQVKAEAFGAAHGTWSTPEMGTVWLVMDLSGAHLPPSPGTKPSSQKYPAAEISPAAARPPLKTQHEENHLHLLPLQGSGEGQFPWNPKSMQGMLKDIRELVKGAQPGCDPPTPIPFPLLDLPGWGSRQEQFGIQLVPTVTSLGIHTEGEDRKSPPGK